MTSLLTPIGSNHHLAFSRPDTSPSSKFMSANHAPNGVLGHEKYQQAVVTPPPSSIGSSFAKLPTPANPFPTPSSSAAGTVPPTSSLDFEQDQDMENAQPLDPHSDIMMEDALGGSMNGKRRTDMSVEEYHDAESPSKRMKMGKDGQPMPSMREVLEQSDVGPLYLVCSRPVPKVYPDPTDNVLRLYGYQAIADSVARFDASGQKNKLRKSYKRYILDLPGKDDYPPKASEGGDADKTRPPEAMDLLEMLDWPDEEWHNQKVVGKEMSKGLDSSAVRRAVTFGPGPIPGFDPAILGLDDSDPMGHRGERQKSHRIHTPGSAGMPTPHQANGSTPGAASAAVTPGDSRQRNMRNKKKRRYNDQSFEGYEDFDDEGEEFSAQEGTALKKKKRRKEHEAGTPLGHSHLSSMKSSITIS